MLKDRQFDNKQLLKSNDMFSKFKGFELELLLYDIYNFYLTYRSKLQLPRDDSFGLEFEYDNLKRLYVDDYVKKNFPAWDSKEERTIPNGGEIASATLHDSKFVWKQVKKICCYLRKSLAVASNLSGGHIHAGAQALGSDYEVWQLLLLLYASYEGELIRFGYGEMTTFRDDIGRHAMIIGNKILNLLDDLINICSEEELWNFINRCDLCFSKWQAVNFRRINPNCDLASELKDNTLEFRFFNGTLEEIIWQNNVNVIMKMLVACKEKRIDKEFLISKLKSRSYDYYSLSSFELFNVQNALEFSDMVFDNNLDKMYFLRQFLKNGENRYSLEEGKSKCFIKR